MIINRQKKESVALGFLIFSFIVLGANNLNAQFQNNGTLSIGDNGYVYVGANTYHFGSGNGQTLTTRTSSVHGKLVFSTGSTNGASDVNYLDGFGSVLTTDSFVFPVGQSGVYAPVKVLPSSTTAVDAAYYRIGAATIGTTLDTSVGVVSDLEYWNIKGLGTVVISLTWRASSVLSNMVSSMDNLTIVGYNGSEWVEIPSAVDETSILGEASSMTSGSITTLSSVDLTIYSYFSFGSKGGSCSPLVASSGNIKTWNGSWFPSVPTITDPVVINSAYSGPSFVCNSLILNANVVLTDGQHIEVVNGVTGPGTIIMSSEASLVQRASGVSAPNIELTKKTRDVMRRYDYIYWGTPIVGNFLSQLSGAQASTAILADSFDLKYKYVSGLGGGWQNLNAIETGKGYITRIKSQAPFTNTTNTDYINLKFAGVANNGDVTVAITNNLNALNAGTSHVLLANPYPSAIDANKFLTENTDIDGVVYIWTAGTVNNGTGQPYTQADYIAYTLAGSVVPNAIPQTFNGKIASGQGFKVKSLSNSGSVTFTNCMRLTSDNNQFYRVDNNKSAVVGSRSSYKLNMTGANAVFSQILISYLPEATLGYDRMYDAGRNSVSSAQLFSVFEADGRKLAINARPPFVNTDAIPLGISKSNTNAEIFTISITEKEGIFATDDINVYIHDILNNTYHNLNLNDFTFTTNDISILGRFEIVYLSNTLSNSNFENGNVIASIKNNKVNLRASQAMLNVEIYDLMGKKIYSSPIDSLLDFKAPFYFAQSIYILKVAFENGATAFVKLINEK